MKVAKNKAWTFFIMASLSFAPFAKPVPTNLNKPVLNVDTVALKNSLTIKFEKNLTKQQVSLLQKEIINHSGKAVPALVEVMKSSKYPDKNRWIATFLMGKVMGKKSSPFISRFVEHPNWVMRMASLKTLLALKEKNYSKAYITALKDDSFIVRKQALDNIKKLEITEAAPNVWAMLYDKKNYYSNKNGAKRTNLIKDAVKTVGDLKFKKALDPLFTMIQKKKYQDIFEEMEYSLQKITGKKGPDSDINTKRRFWKKIALASKTF